MWSTLVPIIVVVLTGTIAASGWLFNEHVARQEKERLRKEERYKSLLASIKGFYQGAENSLAAYLKNEFIKQLELCWLYCPDTVIKKGYAFLEAVQTGDQYTNTEKERALGEFVAAIRKDLRGKRFWWGDKTRLNWADFRILTST